MEPDDEDAAVADTPACGRRHRRPPKTRLLQENGEDGVVTWGRGPRQGARPVKSAAAGGASCSSKLDTGRAGARQNAQATDGCTTAATATATAQRQLPSMRIRRDLAARLWRLLGKRSGEGTTAGSQRRRARWFTLQRMASSMEATVEATATAPAGVREVCGPASAFPLRPGSRANDVAARTGARCPQTEVLFESTPLFAKLYSWYWPSSEKAAYEAEKNMLSLVQTPVQQQCGHARQTCAVQPPGWLTRRASLALVRTRPPGWSALAPTSSTR